MRRLLLFVFSDKRFRGNAVQVLGALTLGLLVVAAWYLSGHIGHGENPDTLETVYFATNTRTHRVDELRRAHGLQRWSC